MTTAEERTFCQNDSQTMTLADVETPALMVDLEVLRANMATLKQLAEPTGMELYPHYKSNKCPAIAQMQIEDGARGITCAKLSEAMDLAEAGIQTIVLANQVVQPSKLKKLADLAGKVDLTVCVDNADNIREMEAAMAAADATAKVLVEYNVGQNRCGARTHEEFLALAKVVDEQPHLVFDGIQAYAGHLAHEVDAQKRKAGIDAIEADVAALKAYVEENGLAVANVAGVSTGTAADKPVDTVYTQLQAGSYLFMDSTYQTLNLSFKQSLFMLATVISVHDGVTILDCGTKSFGMDQNLPVVVGYEDAEVALNEEHLLLKGVSDLKIGTCMKVIPGHCCTTMNLSDKLLVMSVDGSIETLDVLSRGKSA